MSNKTRDISPYDFLQALQREYICLEIRSKIYIDKSDKEYFNKLMHKKESAIIALSKKNKFENIIDNGEEYIRVWKEIVPDFGLPKFIYNIVNVTEKQLQFPYKGTVVRDTDQNRIGISKQVNFEDSEVVVKFHTGITAIIPLNRIQRLNHQDTDEFFYFYPQTQFFCNLSLDDTFYVNRQEAKLISYDIDNKTAAIAIPNSDKFITLHRDKLSRLL